MGLLTAIKHKLRVARFNRRDMRIIESVAASQLNEMLITLVTEGWEVAAQFDTAASLNRQGECIIRRGQSTLRFSLYADQTGAIEGPARVVMGLAKQYHLTALSEPTR